MLDLTKRKEEYLSKENTQALKGLLAIAVLLSHAVPKSEVFYGSVLSSLFGSLGYLSVSVFFFLSAYGISLQYEKRKEDYLNNFPKNRILSIYLLNVFLVVVYGIYHALVGNELTVPMIFQSLLIGNSIVGNGWYLQVIVLFYLIWYLCTHAIKSEKIRIHAISLSLIAYIVISACFLGGTWYVCTLSFLLGVFYHKEKEKIDNICLK